MVIGNKLDDDSDSGSIKEWYVLSKESLIFLKRRQSPIRAGTELVEHLSPYRSVNAKNKCDVQFFKKKKGNEVSRSNKNAPAAVKEAMTSKREVGILYRDAVARDIKRGHFKLINKPGDTFTGKNYIIYHKTRPLSPLAQEFLKLLRSHQREA